MEVRKPKKIPYCLTNYESIRTENYVYVDKTRFIEQLENEQTKYHFLIRPRKFGKSLFLSVLRCYYDICYADKFDMLFGDLYIGQNPTPKRNTCFVIKFSFSGLNTGSVDEIKTSFAAAVRSSIDFFILDHKEIIKDYEEKMKELGMLKDVRAYIEFAFKIIKGLKGKAFIIIDEYDHFANDLIAQGTNLSVEQYKQLIWANGVVRDFYETLKDNSETAIEKIFITGITPIMLDDITSGFNISKNISVDVRYNEILGFTEDEVQSLIDASGIDKTKIKIDIKFLYNGYLFHAEAKNKLYNPSMIMFLLDQLSTTESEIERIIDYNLKTDYSRIKMLLNKTSNTYELENIIEYEQVASEVIERFSIEKLHEPKNFLSLLYYMGLVTIGKDETGRIHLLKIPNYSIKTMYWEYMENMITEQNPAMVYNPRIIYESLIKMTYNGDYQVFFDHFQQNFVSQLSNRDLENFSEKNIKFLLLSILFQSNFYLPLSETENSRGYSDIYLQRRDDLFPNIITDWVWELKYIKQSDVNNFELIRAKKAEAAEQLLRYKNSNLFKDRKDIRYLSILFIGKKEHQIEELKD